MLYVIKRHFDGTWILETYANITEIVQMICDFESCSFEGTCGFQFQAWGVLGDYTKRVNAKLKRYRRVIRRRNRR